MTCAVTPTPGVSPNTPSRTDAPQPASRRLVRKAPYCFYFFFLLVFVLLFVLLMLMLLLDSAPIEPAMPARAVAVPGGCQPLG